MKTTLHIGLLTLSLATAGVAKAQSSLEYDGGPHSQISAAQLESLRSWSKNTQAEIDRLLRSTQPTLDSSDKKRKLFNRMEAIVADSEPRASDLLLRQAMYAGLTVNKLIERETVSRGREFTPQGTVDQQVRVLRRSLELAREYYQSDAAYINGILTQRRTFSNPMLVEFGVKFSKFLIKMSDGVMSASANYGMIRWSLGILNHYLTKDDRNIAYASTIKYLNSELRAYPDIVNGAAAPNDAECVKYVRELKRLAQDVYAEIEQTTRNIVTPNPGEAALPQAPTPRVQTTEVAQTPVVTAPVQAPVTRNGRDSGTETDSWARYEWIRTNGTVTYYVTIPNSPVTHFGTFKSLPVSISINGEVTVIGLGTDNRLYYVSAHSPTIRQMPQFSEVVQIIEPAALNGLPAVRYYDNSGNRITLNIVGQH